MTSIIDILNPSVVWVKTETSLFILLLLAILILAIVYFSRSGHVAEVRKLPAIDALDEIVQSTAERGKPFAISAAGFGGSNMTTFNACLNVAKYLAQRCGEMQVPVHGICDDEKTYLLLSDYVRQGVIESKNPTIFHNENFYYVPLSAFPTESIGFVQKIIPGGAYFFGQHFQDGSLSSVDLARQYGAVSFGTSGWVPGWANCFLVAMCDYSVFSDELVAVSTYLTKDEKMAATVVGLDWVKLFSLGALTILIILGTMGVKLI